MNDSYINSEETIVKRRKTTSLILLSKSFSSFPNYILGIYKPEHAFQVPWTLYMESFHHYHSRIFYLLALYRSLLQIYVALYANGTIQKKFVILESCFDIGIVCLFLSEFSYNNYSPFFIIHLLFLFLSLLTLQNTNDIKAHHIV